MLATRLWNTSYSSHWVSNNNSRPPLRRSSSRMSDKQTLSPPVEPSCQVRHLDYASAEFEAYPMTLTNTRDHTEQRKAGLTPGQGHRPFQSRTLDQDSRTFSPSAFKTSSTIAQEKRGNRGPSSGTEQLPMSKPSESDECGEDDPNRRSASREADNEIEDDEDITEGELQSPGQIVAERLAAHRKLKRFRLTHQQTRFLMSEFAKQPHPDAAHRERLSREIPGLSPRQVQVWFQNRRAKIKRLTADDRERMIRMRAVPDDFDNVQALHSPYGAVRGVATIVSSANSGHMSSIFGNQGAESLMLGTRRGAGDSYLSPTELTPFGNTSTELGQSGPMNVPDIASSVNSLYQDRVATSNVSSPSPSDIGARNCGPCWHSGSSNSVGGTGESDKTVLRESQPIHGRNWASRTALDALITPLGIYHGDTSEATSSERQVEVYNCHFGTPVSTGSLGMESRTYSGNAPVMGRSLDSTMLKEESGQSRTKSPPATTSGQLMMDVGVSDRYRTAELASLRSPAQDALPPLRCDIFSCQTNYSRGAMTSPPDISSVRMFPSSGGKTENYWTSQQLSAPKSAASEYSLARPLDPSVPYRNAGSEVQHIYDHGV
ncbi:hypothetical protein E4U53_005655 [Claviceps sorghi]|nr:hypothetical protein E4U53_005655 [Claviceps sorghi]